jgi:short chain dehydrogenase
MLGFIQLLRYRVVEDLGLTGVCGSDFKSNSGVIMIGGRNENTTTHQRRAAKVAIVMGASSGIGLEAVKRLAANGYRVVANARHITSAKTLSESVFVI